MICQYIEFSNLSLRNSYSYNIPLSRKIGISVNQTVIHSNLIFSFFGIQQQIVTMYHYSSFKSHLRHWANWSQFVNLLSDIYNGDVWKTLKEFSEVDSPNFFRNDVTDSHLDLMLNLDWF